MFLLIARMGVGLGEAGGSPPAHAMISDLYEKEKRGRALALYSAGLYAGTLLGYYLGGWLSEALNWRQAFFVVGIPGVIFADHRLDHRARARARPVRHGAVGTSRPS
jgi:MFS family permease